LAATGDGRPGASSLPVLTAGPDAGVAGALPEDGAKIELAPLEPPGEKIELPELLGGGSFGNVRFVFGKACPDEADPAAVPPVGAVFGP
jgi:hypothetical protein